MLTSKTGEPVEPGNFARTFQLYAERAGLPRITPHHTRHTAATLLKNLGVPDRDAQLILGHSNVTTTQQLYQHADLGGQRKALEAIEHQLVGAHPVHKDADASRAGGVALSNQLSAVENPAEQRAGGSNENSHLTEVEMAEFPGGSGGTRTHDILLKRQLDATFADLPTSVIRDLHTRTGRHIVGRVAVNSAVKTVASAVPSGRRIEQLLLTRRACRRALTEHLRRRSFPLNLIPTSKENA